MKIDGFEVLTGRFWRRVLADAFARNLDLIAAGVAFYSLLAIFPALAAVIAVWGFVADPGIVDAQLELLERLMPPEAFVLFRDQVTALIDANSSTLGWATLASTLAALWATRAGVAALLRGINAIHGNTPQPGLRRTLVSLGVTLSLIATAIVALISVVVVPVILNLLPLGLTAGLALSASRWLIVLALFYCGLSVLYRFGPSRAKGSVPTISRGALAALLLWAASSVGFSVYLSNFGSFNQVYGSIGAVIVLLTWFYISALAILVGALINADAEAREAQAGLDRSLYKE